MMTFEQVCAAYDAARLDGALGILMPDRILVYFEADDTSYLAPDGETASTILDRIERSKKAGRNLFKEEWELSELEPEPGCVY